MRAHRDARFYFRADAIFRDAVDRRAAHRWIGHVDHFGINARAHRFEHGLARAFGGEIDGAGAIEIERDAGFVGRDQSEDNLPDIAAREVVGLERIARNLDASFHRGDAVIDNHSHGNFTQAHPDHFSERDRRVRDPGADPKPEEIEKDDAEDEREEREDRDADKIKGLHAGEVSEGRAKREVYLKG